MKNVGKKKRLAINIISQLFSFAVGLGVSFVLTPYITAKLGKDVYGFVGMAYQVTSYVSVFTVAFNAMLNVFVATSYHKGDYNTASEYFTSVVLLDRFIAFILLIPFALITFFMDLILDVPKSSIVDIKILWLFVFITFLINLGFGQYGVGLYIKNRLDIGARNSLISNFIKAVILLSLFIFAAPRVLYIGMASLMCAVYSIYINFYYFRKLTPELEVKRKHFRIGAVKELFAIGIWNTLNQLTNILVSGLDLMVSNIFINSLAMGYISYAQTVPIQMGNLIAMISNSFAPELNKSHAQGNREAFIDDIKSAIKTCGFICSVPILGFIIFGRDFYALWIPSLTTDEIRTISILSFLILFHTIFDVYIYPLYSVHSIMKKIHIPILVSFGTSVINIILELLLLKFTDLGVYSIEIATALLSMLRVLLFSPIYSAIILKQKWYTFYRPIFKGIIASIVILTIFFLIDNYLNIDSWFKLVITATGSAVIGYIINFIIVLDSQDRKTVIGHIKRLKMNKKN